MKKPYKTMPKIDLGDVALRTIHLRDTLDLFEYGSDPRVTKYLNWGPFIMDSEAKKSIIKIFYPRIKDGLPIGYAIIDKKTSKMIGTIDFHSKIKEMNGAEIGFALHYDYWNKGIMSKCLLAMLAIGFDYLKYDFIKISHLKMNKSSQRVIEKAGFTYIKTENYEIEKRTEVLKDELLIYEFKKEDYHGSQQS